MSFSRLYQEGSSLFGRTVRVLLLLTLIQLSPLAAQTVLMPVTGSADTTMSYVELYDDGGPSAPYSTNCNSRYTFHTVHPQGRYRIEINSQLTHPQGNALLQIKNGPSIYSSTLLTSPNVTNGIFYSSGNTVTVIFNSDDDYPTEGFEVILCEYDNPVAQGINGHYLDSTTYILTWNQVTPPATWVVDYAIVEQNISTGVLSDSNSFQTVITDSTSLTFTNIPVGYHLVYRIYSIDSSPTSICPRIVESTTPPYVEPYICPCVTPLNVSVIHLPDSVRIEWTTDTIVTLWHFIAGHLNIDTILDGSVMHFTIPHDYPCNTHYVSINGNCEFNSCNIAIAPLPTGGCMLSAGSLNRVASDGNSITLSWGQVSDPDARYLLYFRPQDQPSSANLLLDTLPYDSTRYTVTGLQPHTNYIFLLRILCSNGNFSCLQSSANIATTLDNCIDFINLLDAEHIHRTWGTYSNPAQVTYGPAGRHVPIVDTTLYDSHTGNQLRCIPPGEEASFRLGDDNIGAQGETITYDYFVDSLDKDMLVLKYAVVMQNSNHTVVNQPHVTLEILDSAGAIIDTTCCYADFYAAGDLGWNSVPGTNIIWKDWTTVGIDIAPYHGQQIKIRFTTTDCADGGHFGYAYFNIKCDTKRIELVNLCESEDSIRLRAPLGFEYRWTRGTDTTTFSTENEIIVPADLTEYFCRASFIGKPECSFSIHAMAVLPVPQVAMHYEYDTCRNSITFFSDCKVSIDEEFLPYVHQVIDSVTWVIDNDTLYGDTVSVELQTNGYHYIRLSCKLSESFCTDSLADSVWVDFVHRKTILGDTIACYGDTLTLQPVPLDTVGFSFLWDDGSTAATRMLVVSSDTTLQLVSNYLLCSDTLQHVIHMFPHHDDTLFVDACPGKIDTLDFHVMATGIYTHNNVDRYGCDSTYSLSLTIHPVFYDTVRIATCDESYSDDEFSVDTTGFYTHAYTTVWGCDSIYHLDFHRHPVWNDTLYGEILYGDSYIGYGFDESVEGFYEHLFVDRNGCDSIRNLDLSVIFLQFPNAVTPNGDGYNDRLVIVNFLDATIFDYSCLWVYDRWGRLIYKKEGIYSDSDFWDPNKTGTPDGTYFYRFFARAYGHIIDHKSAVEVLR